MKALSHHPQREIVCVQVVHQRSRSARLARVASAMADAVRASTLVVTNAQLRKNAGPCVPPWPARIPYLECKSLACVRTRGVIKSKGMTRAYDTAVIGRRVREMFVVCLYLLCRCAKFEASNRATLLLLLVDISHSFSFNYSINLRMMRLQARAPAHTLTLPSHSRTRADLKVSARWARCGSHARDNHRAQPIPVLERTQGEDSRPLSHHYLGVFTWFDV